MQANSGNIILIGMPGSGKSTCGVVAAKLLLKNFFDTDLLIQNREGRRLQQIIDEKGLDYFARAEEEAVLSLDIAGTVIATGGSVVYSPAAMDHLRRMGKVIYLHLEYETVFRIWTVGVWYCKRATPCRICTRSGCPCTAGMRTRLLSVTTTQWSRLPSRSPAAPDKRRKKWKRKRS